MAGSRHLYTQYVTEVDFSNEEWLALAESSFAKDWDNELDATYDLWRELYVDEIAASEHASDAD